MRRDPGASTTADPAQRGVESDPRRWPARSLACAQTIAQIELRALATDSSGPQADGDLRAGLTTVQADPERISETRFEAGVGARHQAAQIVGQ